MLFTAPEFVFLFLPLSVLLYAVCGKGRRRIGLFAVSVFYHLLMNLFHPQNLLFIPVLALYCWGCGRLLARFRQRWLALLLGALPFGGLLLMRHLAYVGVENFTYPVGLTVMTLGALSYLVESVRGNVPKRMARPLDLILYLSFFPVLIVGPFIKYTDFLRLTSEEEIEFSTARMAEGAKLFAVGFIKRVAIGMVLMDTFERFSAIAAGNSEFLIGAFLLILIYFGVFFTVSGYLDMGCGIALMYGVRLPYTSANPFRAATPAAYGRTLFGSYVAWLEDYVVGPMERMTGGRGIHWIRAAVVGCGMLLVVRSSPYVLLLALPFVLIGYFISRYELQKQLATRHGLRVLATLATIAAVSVCWVILTKGDFWAVAEYISSLSYVNSEYHMDLMLVTFSDRRYLFVLAVSIFTLLPHLGIGRSVGRSSEGGRLAVEIISTVTVLVLFAFTLLFFLPGASAYDDLPFRYMFI